MKIIDRAAFLALPAETIFAKYEPHFFGELKIKGDTVGNDFLVQEIIPWFTTTTGMDYFDQLVSMQEGGPSPPLDYDCQGRDGMFDAEQLFAVFEPADVKALVERLQRALPSAASAPTA